MNEWRFFYANGGNQSWQVGVSLRGNTKMAQSKMAAIIQLSENEWVLSQIELVWVRIRVEWECFWVNLREENKVSESNMVEFKMAAIIKFESEWMSDVFSIQHGRIQDGCPHQIESEWMSEGFFFCANGGNQSWQVWVSFERKTKVGWIQDGQIKDGRIQDGCH